MNGLSHARTIDQFEFKSVGRILFGRGQFARIGELASGLGRTALVIANGGDPGDGGMVDDLAARLSAAGMPHVFVRQRGEPTITDVERGLEEARRNGCDLVIGLGGGSAIDAAKAVAALITNGGAPIDYMEVIGKGMKVTRPAAPWIAVPTTAGTGAEVTPNAVVSCPEKHFKASIRGPDLLARAAVVDPELGLGVPPETTARAGMDALCQLIESYTSTGAQPMTDALAIKGMSLAATALPRAYADGGDLDAREAMALAALLGGITLANAGLGAVHGFAAPLGANFPIPHGVVCGLLLPHVIAANVRALRAQPSEPNALSRYAAVGRALTAEADLSDSDAIDSGLRFATDIVRELNIPPLGRFGLAGADIPGMVALARRSSSMRYNPVSLSQQDLARILEEAM